MEQSTRSTNRSFKKLVASHGITPAEIYSHICAQTVDLVFTAHPTQVQESMRKPFTPNPKPQTPVPEPKANLSRPPDSGTGMHARTLDHKP